MQYNFTLDGENYIFNSSRSSFLKLDNLGIAVFEDMVLPLFWNSSYQGYLDMNFIPEDLQKQTLIPSGKVDTRLTGDSFDDVLIWNY